tara:strand:- start:3926 stop:4027 length:102 start_codon:yes stop_codon:yes gene_type:complete
MLVADIEPASSIGTTPKDDWSFFGEDESVDFVS